MRYTSLLVALLGFTLRSVDAAACEDMLVLLPDDNVLLRYFDHFSIIGRYKRVGEELLWTQINGRHQVVIKSARDTIFGNQLSFLAASQTSNTTEYIGLDGTFSYSFDPYKDSDYIYTLHSKIFSWAIYNHTFNDSIVTFTYQFDELYIYCVDGGMLNTVCTGDRVLDVNLYLNHDDGSHTVVNDPAVNVFMPVAGMYSGNRAVYVQDDMHFSIKYVDSRAIHAWTVLYNSSGTLSTLYVSTNYNEAAPVPELTAAPWTGYFYDEDDTIEHAVICSAKLLNCTQCNSTSTDICLQQTNGSLYYCVCSLGYQGETCNQPSAACHDPPADLFGWVPDYYQGGPFYSGEIITVSCNADYPSLLSRWKYISTCTDAGNWTVERLCLDYTLIDASINRSNHPQVLLALIDEVESRITTTTSTSPFTEFVSQSWLIATVLSVWVLLPLISMLIGRLCQRCRRDSRVKPRSLWKMVSVHTYIWLCLYLVWEVVSLSFAFSKSTSDLFFYMDVLTAVWLVMLYLFHILSMFLCPEMSVLSKKYPVLTRRYFDAMKDCNNPELSVTAERYYTEEITRNVLKTNDSRRLCKESITSLEPVVTECFRQVFSYETCRDATETPHLEPHTIVKVQLHLEVSFSDDNTRDKFYEMRSQLETASKATGSEVNVFQLVGLTTEEHQLRKGLNPIVHGVVEGHRFYTNVWSLRIFTFFLLGLPLQLYLASRVIKSAQQHVIRKVVSGVKGHMPIHSSVLSQSSPT